MTISRFASLIALILASFASVPLLCAQEPAIPLDTVLVAVTTRGGEQLGSSTRSVEVIDHEQLLNSPAQTIVEALEWGFGVDLMPRSPALVDIGIRGSSFEQVLVLVDGVRMRDGQTGHFNLNLNIPLEQVERVELLRGPASSLYGSDALAGVINIVTRKRREGSTASLSAGSFERLAGTVSHAQSFGSVWADLAGSVDRSDGHRTGTDYEMGNGRLALTLPVGGQEISAEVAHAKRDFGADGFYGAYNSFEATRTTTGVLRASFRPGSRLVIDPSLRLRRNSDVFTLYRDNPSRYQNRHRTLQVGGDVIGRLAMSKMLQAAVGAHFFQDQVRSTSLGDRDESTAALSAEITAQSSGRATATLGIRADRLPTDDILFAPSISAAWWPTQAIRVHSSAGHSYRAPTWTERFYRDPVNIGNDSLSAEQAWSGDVGVDIHPVSAVRIGGSAFIRDASELIDWARPAMPVTKSDSIWHTTNVADARFRGIEVEIDVLALAGTRLRARGSWLSLESSAAPGLMSKYALRPEVESISLSADRGFFDVLHLSVRGARERRVGEANHIRLDSRASIQARQVRLYLDLLNATDTDYMDISGIPVAGRNAVMGLELRR